MSVKLPTGTTFAIATAYGASKTMSAVTNANPGVATLEAAHGVVLGDFMEKPARGVGIEQEVFVKVSHCGIISP